MSSSSSSNAAWSLVQARASFEDSLKSVFAAKNLPTPAITDETELLGGTIDLDSLDLAEIVVRLTNASGYDPFENGFVPFRTAGELIRLYANDHTDQP
jgi:acyl carrier protein